jgi:hypothetical protein
MSVGRGPCRSRADDHAHEAAGVGSVGRRALLGRVVSLCRNKTVQGWTSWVAGVDRVS